MSVILEDSLGKSINVNAWNWGVLHYAVACAEPPVFDDPDFLKLLRRGSVTLSKEQVDKLFDYLLKAVFPRLKPGQRMLADFSVTDEPDDGTFHKDDLKKNYSLSCEVLLIILEFLHEGKPPIKVM